MPASIAPLLLLWSALIPSGWASDPGPSMQDVPAIRRDAPGPDHPATIRALLPEDDRSWLISEADTGERESDDDGDDDSVVARGRPALDPASEAGHVSANRFNLGIIRSPWHSPILRC